MSDYFQSLKDEMQQMEQEGYSQEQIEEYANESLQDIREQEEFERQLEAQRMAQEQQDSEARYWNGLDPDDPNDDL